MKATCFGLSILGGSVSPLFFPPEANPPSKYDTNRTGQYAALGQFVEAFERMVDETRQGCVDILALSGGDKRLVEIAFHHQAMTAKPLFDILRALIAETVNNPKAKDYPTRDAFAKVLVQISAQYEKLSSMRNSLLHGTWFVGYSSADDPDSERFHIRKFVTNKDGLKQLELPGNSAEIDMLTMQCYEVSDWIMGICACLDGHPGQLDVQSKFFNHDTSPRILNAKNDTSAVKHRD